MTAQNKESFKDTVMGELIDNGYTGLYDKLDSLDIKSDEDFKNIIAGYRDYILDSQKIPKSSIDNMTNFEKALKGTVGGADVDLDKAFPKYGKDWYKHLNDIPTYDIQEVADNAGIDWRDLANRMSKEATSRLRADIANGEDLGGWFESPASFLNHLGAKAQQFFTPRVNESIARGEDPKGADYALDFGEQALYAIPWGRGITAVGSGLSKAGKALGKVGEVFSSKPGRWLASDAVTPIISEGADAIVYDDENNPRSKFSLTDVLGNTLVNAATTGMINGVIPGVAQVFGIDNLAKYFKEFGEGKTAREYSSEHFAPYKHIRKRDRDYAAIPHEQRVKAGKMDDLSNIDPNEYRGLTKNPTSGKIEKGSKWTDLEEIIGTDGRHAEEKMKNLLKNRKLPEYSYIMGDGRIYSADDAKKLYDLLKSKNVSLPGDHNLVKHINNPKKYPYTPVSPEILKIYDKYGAVVTPAENAKKFSELATEEAFKNFLSNHIGPNLAEQRRSVWDMIPVFGPLLEKQIYGTKEEQKLKEEALRRDKILKALGIKYPGVSKYFEKKPTKKEN